MKSPARLLIFGSCVSRDILNYPQAKAQFALVDYYARSSIASLGARNAFHRSKHQLEVSEEDG
jgi:Family of unknown function (DUF6270)